MACYRAWAPPVTGAPAGPDLEAAFHHTNFGINFNSQRDEYVTIWFGSTRPVMSLDEVKPAVGGYGVRPIHVGSLGDNRQAATFKLPPGLSPGMHEVTLRLRDSGPGPGRRIASKCRPALSRVCDGKTREPDQLNLGQGDILSLWIWGLPGNADKNNVEARWKAAFDYVR